MAILKGTDAEYAVIVRRKLDRLMDSLPGRGGGVFRPAQRSRARNIIARYADEIVSEVKKGSQFPW